MLSHYHEPLELLITLCEGELALSVMTSAAYFSPRVILRSRGYSCNCTRSGQVAGSFHYSPRFSLRGKPFVRPVSVIGYLSPARVTRWGRRHKNMGRQREMKRVREPVQDLGGPAPQG